MKSFLLGLFGIDARRHEIPFVRHFTLRTVAGFLVQSRLRGTLVIDNSKRIGCPIPTNKETRDKILTDFEQHVLVPFFCDRALTLGWTYMLSEGIERPWVWLYEFDEHRTLQRNTTYSFEKFVRESGTVHIGDFTGKWCECYVTDCSAGDFVLHDPAIIKENYKMLNAETLALIGTSEPYQRIVECETVAALKRRIDLMEASDEHQNGDLTVRWSITDQAVRLAWAICEDARRKGFGVKGFRREGSFHSDPWSESMNGDLVVDSRVNDSTIDHPPAGSSQFYTFMLVRPLKKGEIERCDFIRFQVRVPKASDVEALKKALEQHRAALRERNKPRNERLARLMSAIDFDVETTTALMSAEKQRVERVKARTDFTPEEKDIIIEEIQRRFEAARMQIAY